MYENMGSDTYPLEAETKDFFEKAAGEGLEMRQGQVEMAQEICEAIKDHKPLAVEAEVGIGKSYAYLVPAVMEYLRTNKQIIIATSTIALQEQLMKDSKSVMKMIWTSIEITVAKGMRNYICPRRLNNAIKRQKDKEIYQSISAMMNKKGSDRASVGINIPDKEWELINVQNYGEKCHNCIMKSSCGYYTLREQLRKGHGIVICNQNMLVAHLQNLNTGGRGIFNPDGGMVIVDEAHNLESKFRESVTTSFSRDELENIVRSCITKTPNRRKAETEKYVLDTIEYIELLYKRLIRQVREQRKTNRH